MRMCPMRIVLAVISLALLPTVVRAQGAIGGVARDSSGGVLPGVTVEAESPALIERVRTAVTDDRGQYLIVDLRPGTYMVTFTLAGFNTLKREGLVLSAGVTLPVNADLMVGSLQETITVSGETPVVDIQNTRERLVVGREVLDSIPRGHNMQATASLLPGVMVGSASNNALQDQGGSSGEPSARIAAHGSNPDDFTQNMDGIRFYDFAAGNATWIPPDADIQEFVFEASAVSAEGQTSGIRANIVPKEGGNTFTPTVYGSFTNTEMSSNNLSAGLKQQGLTTTDRIDKIWDVSLGLGGPVKRDKLWFHASYRNWGADRLIADSFFERDPTRQAVDLQHFQAAGGRLTWQATPRNKFSFYVNDQRREIPYFRLSALVTPEAAVNQHDPLLYLWNAKWSTPVTNRLLIETGTQRFVHHQFFDYSPASLENDPNAWPVFEITTGKSTGAAGPHIFRNSQDRGYVMGTTASLSYVTGSHAFKVGFQHYEGHRPSTRTNRYDAVLRMNNGVPFQAVLISSPVVVRPRIKHDLGFYAQDQWTLSRLTLNAGLRFDYFNGQIDSQDSPAGRYVPARHYDEIRDVPDWKDFSPRVGGVWDVFGNGKTAIKGSAGRYVATETTNFATNVNPLLAGQPPGPVCCSQDIRTWNDRNGDRIPQLDELGPSTNLAFGLPIFAVRPDEALREGWGVRNYNWEYTASVQQQLLPGLAANLAYYHRRFGNLTWTNNRAVRQSDYNPFTIASPIDGQRITMYNLAAAKRGVIDNVIEFAPGNRQVYDGLDVTVTGKFGRGGLVNGGISMGRTDTESCTAFDPNTLLFCKVSPSFTAENVYKGIVAHPLPYGIQGSLVFQSFAGPRILANYTVTSAIAGVPHTNGTVTIPLVEPGSQYGERSNRVDVRITKLWTAGRKRVEPIVEVFNLLNASPVLGVNTTYGPTWQRPTATALGRMLKVGVRVDF